MMTVQLILAVFGVTLGCSLLYGYNIGVLNNINDVRNSIFNWLLN